MNEIIFMVSEPPEGGYAAEALGHSIYTVAESLDELEEGSRPKIIRPHFVSEELLYEGSEGVIRRGSGKSPGDIRL